MTTYTIMTFITAVVGTIKSQGLKAAWKTYGWKLVALVFTYYLIRDTLLYLVIPFVIYQWI